MDWLSKMNQIIDYIENHLTSEIDYEKIAQIACSTTYNFQRMFSFITDIPLSEYIRRRRLTLAAFELQQSDIKIIDLAFKYGYDSPNSFTRAFQFMHGITPSQARSNGVKLKAFPRLSFHLSIKGDEEMNYKIEEKESFTVYGYEAIISTLNDSNLMTIPDFWKRVMQEGSFEKLCQTLKREDQKDKCGLKSINAVMCYKDTGKNTFPYMICAMADEDIPEGFVSTEIPRQTWVIFKSEEHTIENTTQVIQKLWKRIYSEWLPTSGYEFLEGPEFEMYGKTENNLEYCEVWIPIKKQ